MNFNIAAFTHKGTVREVNQDRILVNGELMEDGVLTSEHQLSCCCFVADGVGGSLKGEFASQFVLESVKKEVCADSGEFSKRMKKINLDLIETSKKDASIRGTATTLTGIYIDPANFYVYHAGDSQLWLFRENRLTQISTDQAYDDSPNSPIISYFGGEEDRLDPDSTTLLTESALDDYYLLCSDGLFKSVDFDTVKNTLLTNKSLSEKVKFLLDKSLSNGAPDNTSVILVHHTVAEDVETSNDLSKERPSTTTQNNNTNADVPTGIVSMNYSEGATGIINNPVSSEKTGVVGSNQSDSTGVIGDSNTNRPNESLHGLIAGDTIELKGSSYSILDIISEGTGEASVYLVADAKSTEWALKIYKEFDNPKHEPNPEALARIREINDSDILKLHDYGVGLDKYQGKYCFEICDYAEGGDLQVYAENHEVTIDFVEKQLIPEIFQGIKLLHEHRIYHCDIKPGNIFFFDKAQNDIVIGDYGSAKTFDKDSMVDVQSTTTVKGTNVFMAPEQGRGHVSEKNDYYSLGMILLSLIYPEQLKSFREITVRQIKGVKIIDYNKKYERINNLIEGLTLNSFVNRFGKVEIEKWLQGEKVPVIYPGQNTSLTPVKLGGGKLIETSDDFIALLESDKNWYAKYIENTSKSSTWEQILLWVYTYKDAQARDTFEGIRKYYALDPKFLKEAFIRFFEPSRKICIDTLEFDFHNASDVVKQMNKFVKKIDEIWKITDWKDLQFYLFQCEFSLRQLTLVDDSPALKAVVDKFLAFFGIHSSSFEEMKAQIHTTINEREIHVFRTRLLDLFYGFNSNRGFKDYNNNEYMTLQELGFFYIKQPQLYGDEKLIIEKEAFLKKMNSSSLSLMSFKVFIFEVFKQEAQTEIEFISLTFDKHRDNVLHYKFYKSLNNFLITKNIHSDFTDRSDNNSEYVNKRKLFYPFWKFADEVISDLSRRHTIVTLTKQNKAAFKKKFVLRSLIRYIYIYSGQTVALLILIASIYFSFMLLTNKLSLDEHWHFYKGVKTKTSQSHEFCKTAVDNVYFSNSFPIDPNDGLVKILKKGTEVEITGTIEEGQWQEVIYRGEKGYVSVGDQKTKYLSYSRTFKQ